MKIGFYVSYNKFSMDSKFRQVLGDELLVESLCQSINRQFPDIEAKLYAPNFLPTERLAVMIYLHETKPKLEMADAHVSYIQNGNRFAEDAEQVIRQRERNRFDGYIFFSKN